METENKGQLNLAELTFLIIGSVIGGGIFNLMHDMAKPAGLGGVIIGWTITVIGMLTLVLTFRNLNLKRPDLDSGIYSYAQEGFGRFMGFSSAWGYWAFEWLGNVTYATLVMSAVANFFPIFDDGQNIWSILAASVILWLTCYLIWRGLPSASLVNAVVTIAKLVPIFIFIVILIISFKLNIFTGDFWATPSGHFEFSSVLGQARGTMLATVWVYAGIEGAVAVSGRAKRRSDVGVATVLGFLGVSLIYILVTILSFGAMQRSGLSHLSTPAMADLLRQLVGPWGAALVDIGLVISVLGAWLSATIMAVEVPYEAAKKGTFPKWFGQEDNRHVPWNSLLLTTVLIQIFVFLFLVTPSAYTFFYSVTTAAVLIPYAFSAFYQLKYTWKETSYTPKHKRNMVVGIISSIYALWLLYAAGANYLLLITVLYAAGIPVYWYLQKKQNHAKKVFTPLEAITAAVITMFALYTLWLLLHGELSF